MLAHLVVEGAEGVSPDEEGGALPGGQPKVLLEEVRGHLSISVRVGVALSPGCLPGLVRGVMTMIVMTTNDSDDNNNMIASSPPGRCLSYSLTSRCRR